MAAEDRVDVLTKLIGALEKSFPVTNLTGAMKAGLNKLELKRLSVRRRTPTPPDFSPRT